MTIHHIYANRSNAGDWLSARGIQHALQPLAVREHRCDQPFVRATLQALADATAEDFIVIGGGGLLMDYFTPFWTAFEPLSRRVPFCLWGVGCCDGKRTPTLPPVRLLESILARSRFCFLRDQLSRELFAGVSLPPAVPCPSLLAVATTPVTGRRILHVDHYDVVGPDVYERMEALIGAFAAATGRERLRANNLIRDGDEGALQALLARYASADLIVSSRLHGCILGLASGRRVVAVSGDRKVEAFMTAAGLADWVCDAQDVKRLPDLLERAEEQQRFPADFLGRARTANHAIAASIRGVIARCA